MIQQGKFLIKVSISRSCQVFIFSREHISITHLTHKTIVPEIELFTLTVFSDLCTSRMEKISLQRKESGNCVSKLLLIHKQSAPFVPA